jgi:hypothetical protein
VNTENTDEWIKYDHETDRPDDSTKESGMWMLDPLDEQHHFTPELPVWSIENAKSTVHDQDNAHSKGQSPITHFWNSD